MKVKKAIKKIAALGVGATMVGATLLGASAAYTMADYPAMFLDNGMFNGLASIGGNADTIDTFGVVNIMTKMQADAKTVTEICGSAAAGTTTVTGEKVEIAKTGDDLNLGEDLDDIQDVALDDGDLPTILADGTYEESEGETDNDVTYTQEIAFTAGTGTLVFAQDDDDAPDAGVYLLFDKNVDIYTYTLEFDDLVEYTATVADADEDLESTSIEMQGKPYTITQVDMTAANAIEKMTLMSGDSVMWIAQDETVTKEINGVEHEITMLDVSENEDSCGFLIDGTSVWIDDDETQTVGGVTLGVTDAKAIHNVNYDQDICKVFIGAEELILDDTKEVKIAGKDVDGSRVDITSDVTADTWEDIQITYDPDDDLYLAPGDEWVDPVFGNFKVIMGNVIADNEELVVATSSADMTFTFTNYDDKEIELPFNFDITLDAAGRLYYGDDFSDVSDTYYMENNVCNGAGDITNCVGARFLAVDSGDVAHIIELAAISDPIDLDPEIDFDDITYGTSTNNQDYANGADQDFDLGSGVGTIELDIDTAAGTITFDDIGWANDIKTANGGIVVIDQNGAVPYLDVDGGTGFFEEVITFTENDDEANHADIAVDFQAHATEADEIIIEGIDYAANGAGAPGAWLYAAVDKSDTDSDRKMYATEWGSIVELETDDDQDLSILHPEAQLYAQVFVAEASATASSSEGSSGDCVMSEKVNQIPDTVNKFDYEISNPKAFNIIAVGGPCANSVSAAFLDDPEDCAAGFESGKAILQLFDWGNGKYGFLVAGGLGKDTLLASKIVQNYDKYDLSGMKMVATTVSADQLSVSEVTETA